ncbi:MAG: hypothetical protein H7175_22445 [Burkholderiales bacterium]|nr:hypothetical protein [Anaerolineae bacterium]
MSTIATFRVKRPRPTKLSDPFRDFSGDTLAKLLATPDDKLDASQYRNLLGFLPAGTYEEVIYFLPGAFRYFIANEEAAFDIPAEIIRYVSINKIYLDDDGILETVRDCLRECLDRCTKEFVVIHKARAVSQTSYIDDVKHSDFIAEFTFELVSCETHADLIEQFVRGLSDNNNDPVKSAWFLEYSARLYSPAVDPEPVRSLVKDQERLNMAADIVRHHSEFIDTAPTYWRDTFKLLNIE